MKIRTDFVTNSSSSSFIIGKYTDDNITLDSVYQSLRSKFRQAINYISEVERVVAEHTDICNISKGYINIKGKGITYRKNTKKLGAIFEERFGSISEELLYIDTRLELPEWVDKCETYADYVRALDNNLYDARANRFSIIDYTKPTFCEWVYGKAERKYSLMDNELATSIDSEVLNWYYTDVEEAFRRSNEEKYKGIEPEKCYYEEDYCTNYGTDEENTLYRAEAKRKFEELVQRIKDENIEPESACLYLLGKYCIFSEDGYLPYIVTCLLGQECTFSCNHMG